MSKGLEALEKGFWKLTHKGNIKFYNVVEKELKALEIIKEKACIDMLDNSNNIKGYGLYILSTKLTQEEYDLLKEVLL